MTRIDTSGTRRFYAAMRFVCAMALLWCMSYAFATTPATPDGRPQPNVSSLPISLDPDFQFRKTKIFKLEAQVPKSLLRAKAATNLSASTSTSSKSTTPSTVAQEQSLLFERSYRLYGAVTAYDQRQRFGEYFDFFWRAKRPSDVTVRFEYKQDKLRAFVQAKELAYTGARGTCHSGFRVIGEEFANDGAVLAWRCLLIANRRIVAEKRSFLWD
jgi:hypothetical protein